NGDEIEINDQPASILIEYACVQAGHTDITLTINLLPKGQLQWTFEKYCSEEFGVQTAPQPPPSGAQDGRKPAPAHPAEAGITPGGSGDMDNVMSEFERYRRLGEGSDSDYAPQF